MANSSTSKRLQLGVLVNMPASGQQAHESFTAVRKMGLDTCQLCSWKAEIFTQDLAKQMTQAGRDTGVDISLFWAGYSGENVWNFLRGPATIGIVPEATRALRVAELKKGAEFAAWMGTSAIATHLGFIPEDPNDPTYPKVVDAVRQIAIHCKERNLKFLFETGQETPVTLLRLIDDVGTGNLGINLDPANLVMYGKANPVDALDVFGKYVWGMHAKDGLYPTNSRELGVEVALGKGKVDFPKLLARLKEFNFPGPVTIEREIEGDQQTADIRMAMELLSPHL